MAITYKMAFNAYFFQIIILSKVSFSLVSCIRFIKRTSFLALGGMILGKNNLIAPWDVPGNKITTEDRDSLLRLIEFDKKYNRQKSLHVKLMIILIAYSTFVFAKYYLGFALFENSFYLIDILFNETKFIEDVFIVAALFVTTTLTYNLREKAKADFKSLKSEIVDLANKEWYKKYNETNSKIFEYLIEAYKIRINHKT